jgi:hypothetical protein
MKNSSEVKKRNYALSLGISGFWLLFSNIPFPPVVVETRLIASLPQSIASLPPLITSAPKTSGKFICSNEKLETITTYMLRDLPSYTNRATQRARRLRRKVDIFNYVVVAGRPEFKPLPLSQEGIGTDTSTNTSEGVEQLFFTTLGRQYTSGKAIELQEFHWLFLTKAKSGWQMVMMFSQIGSSSSVTTPPRDSSNGAIAQGVKAWLRDCNAGSLRTIKN